MQYSVKKRIIIVTVLGVLLITTITGGVFFYSKNQTKPITPKKKELVVAEKTKPSDSKDYKTLADQRLKQLTGGISIQDVEGTKPEITAPLNSRGAQAKASISSANELSQTPNTKKAAQLQNNNQQVDDLIFYSEIENKIYAELQYISNKGGSVVSPSTTGKTVTNKTWTSTNYSKFISFEAGKTTNFSLFTPDYNVNYIGGEYAIQELFPEKQFFSPILSPNYGRDSEISFLKSLLNDSNIQNLGNIKKDDKNLQLFETKPPLFTDNPDKIALPNGELKMAKPELQTAQFSTKYYVDTNTFELYLTEFYQNGQLQSSSKTITTKEYQHPVLVDYFNTNEIKNTPIKEVSVSFPSPEDNSLLSFNQKYPIYYSDELYKPEKNISFYINQVTKSDFFKLYNSIKYNPSLNLSDTVEELNPMLGTYSLHSINSNGVYSYRVNIYKDQPSITGADYGVYSVFSQKYGDYFYQFNQLSEGENIKPQATFTSLTPGEIKNITEKINLRNDSYPQYDQTSFSKISKEIRLTPGDLSKDFNGLELGNISHSPKEKNTDTCYDQLDSVYLIIPCLVEKYKGFTMYFRRVSLNSPTPIAGNSTSDILEYVDISVIDTPLKNIDLIELRNKVKDTPDFIDSLSFPDFYEMGGKTIITTNQGEAQQKNIQKIIQQMAIDKDLDILEKQLDKNSQNQVYSSTVSSIRTGTASEVAR